MNERLDECRTLPVAQRALLWCLRMWVLHLSRGVDVEPEIDDMLDTLGVPGIAAQLRDLVHALSESSTRMIEVRCVCQERLSADERALLDILSLAQALDFPRARVLLRRFVTADGADAVLEMAQAIGTALICAGHSLAGIEEQLAQNGLTRAFDMLPAAHDTVH